jgi:hypothetical protein
MPCISEVGFYQRMDGTYFARLYMWTLPIELWETAILWRSDDDGETWDDITADPDVAWRHNPESVYAMSIEVELSSLLEGTQLQVEIPSAGESNIIVFTFADGDPGCGQGGDRTGTDRIIGARTAPEKPAPDSGESTGNNNSGENNGDYNSGNYVDYAGPDGGGSNSGSNPGNTGNTGETNGAGSDPDANAVSSANDTDTATDRDGSSEQDELPPSEPEENPARPDTAAVTNPPAPAAAATVVASAIMPLLQDIQGIPAANQAGGLDETGLLPGALPASTLPDQSQSAPDLLQPTTPDDPNSNIVMPDSPVPSAGLYDEEHTPNPQPALPEPGVGSGTVLIVSGAVVTLSAGGYFMLSGRKLFFKP